MRTDSAGGQYSKLLHQMRWLSMPAAFLISIATVTDLVLFINLLATDGSGEWLRTNLVEAVIMTGFQSAIATVFGLRFIAFAKGSPWLMAQSSWIACWSVILIYKLVTAKFLFGAFFGHRSVPAMDAMYYDTFLGASDGLFVLLIGYFVLSPVKELVLIATLIGRRTKVLGRKPRRNK